MDGTVAARESKTAFELGADGVYLIDKFGGDNTKPLFEAYNLALSESVDKYIGLNLLSFSPVSAMMALSKSLKEREDGLLLPPSGLWVNNMRADLRKDEAIKFRDSDTNLTRVRLLGGVACRKINDYTNSPDTDDYDNPDTARYETLWLEDVVDVVVTSGPKDGSPPSVEKCLAMKEVIGKKLFAVASGLSLENIGCYEGIVNEAIITEGVETYYNSGRFDTFKLEALIKAAHNLAN